MSPTIVCRTCVTMWVKLKKGNSNIEFPFFYGWVAGGTRTHDIQNHNLTL